MTEDQTSKQGTSLTELTVTDVQTQVSKIQTLMKSLMKEDEHYGTIPGTQKPTLLKAGAEKLGFIFRLAPRFTVMKTELEGKHREYIVTCTLEHIQNKFFAGEGVGICSTMESKYRYRAGEAVDTGRSVPKEYWENRDQSILGGKGFSTKKIEGQWRIVQKGDKEENPDIADTYNTVLKMAKKRAHIDAILTATAASDIFTQDVEDFTETEPNAEKKQSPKREEPENVEITIMDDINPNEVEEGLKKTKIKASMEMQDPKQSKKSGIMTPDKFATDILKRIDEAEDMKKLLGVEVSLKTNTELIGSKSTVLWTAYKKKLNELTKGGVK